MLASEQAIVIAGTGEDWPDGRTLTPRKPTREPNGTLWFGADLDPKGDQVWFWMEEEAIRRMPDATPEARGRRLDALHVWLAADRSLKCGINPFEIRVAENGDTWIARLRWVRRTSTPSGPKLERPGVTPSTLTRDRDC